LKLLTHFVEDDLQQMRRQDRRAGPILEEAGRRDLLAEVARARRQILGANVTILVSVRFEKQNQLAKILANVDLPLSG
jgi:hypothetical protein